MEIYIEIGKKKVFAGAVSWPGWCRSGRDRQAAMTALLACGPRYARIVRATEYTPTLPETLADFNLAIELEGNAITDFGAPDVALPDENEPVDTHELHRWLALNSAGWQAFAATTMAAAGRELRKGPRGGGRDREKIISHVLDAHSSYLKRIAWKMSVQNGRPAQAIAQMAQATQTALTAAVIEGLPSAGPRGGKIWTPRRFVRSAAWHLFDHLWEIEDRLI